MVKALPCLPTSVRAASSTSLLLAGSFTNSFRGVCLETVRRALLKFGELGVYVARLSAVLLASRNWPLRTMSLYVRLELPVNDEKADVLFVEPQPQQRF